MRYYATSPDASRKDGRTFGPDVPFSKIASSSKVERQSHESELAKAIHFRCVHVFLRSKRPPPRPAPG